MKELMILLQTNRILTDYSLRRVLELCQFSIYVYQQRECGYIRLDIHAHRLSNPSKWRVSALIPAHEGHTY